MTLELLTQAINEYRADGIELMKCLGEEFGYDILVEEQYEKLISRGNPKVPRKGELSQGVIYVFHGGECFFHKKKTQQNIEVILTNAPKFGKIDAWFLKAYLDSSNKYKEASINLGYQDLKAMVEKLYQARQIARIMK